MPIIRIAISSDNKYICGFDRAYELKVWDNTANVYKYVSYYNRLDMLPLFDESLQVDFELKGKLEIKFEN